MALTVPSAVSGSLDKNTNIISASAAAYGEGELFDFPLSYNLSADKEYLGVNSFLGNLLRISCREYEEELHPTPDKTDRTVLNELLAMENITGKETEKINFLKREGYLLFGSNDTWVYFFYLYNSDYCTESGCTIYIFSREQGKYFKILDVKLPIYYELAESNADKFNLLVFDKKSFKVVEVLPEKEKNQ